MSLDQRVGFGADRIQTALTRDPNSVLRVGLPTGAPEVVADVGQGESVTILAGIAVDSTHAYVGDAMRGPARGDTSLGSVLAVNKCGCR